MAEADDYARDPSPERALKLRSAFRELQNNPPPFLRAAFFPNGPSTVAHYLQRAGLYRPFLKTDQGPSGTFLPFVTGGSEELRTFRVTQREGVAVPEAHVQNVLGSDGELRSSVDRVQRLYQNLEFAECGRALEDIAAQVGFERRSASVGRGLFFFCNASGTDTPITIPEHICLQVERTVNDLIARMSGKAAHAKALYRDGASLQEALATAQEAESVGPTLYFQADVYLTSNGDVYIDQIHLPDLGLFLCELPVNGHVILPQVQRIVRQLRESAVKLLATLPSAAYLVTRPAVLHHQEDVLESLEIQALQKMGTEAGVEFRLRTPCEAAQLPNGAQVFLLNVDLTSSDCEVLLQRVARGELECTPDPFLKLLAPELTTLRRIAVQGAALTRFLQTIRGGAQMNAKSYGAMHDGIERIYDRGKLSADVLHVEVPGERTAVPTLRHSTHSFTSLYNTCRRNNFPDLHFREIPVTRTNTLVHGEFGPHLAAFRFFFTRS